MEKQGSLGVIGLANSLLLHATLIGLKADFEVECRSSPGLLAVG
jgi:hypothetical protein